MINQEKNIQKFLNNIFKNSRITDIPVIKYIKIVKVGNDGSLFIFDDSDKLCRVSPMLLELIRNTFGAIDLELIYRLTISIIETKFNMNLTGYSKFED